MSIPKNLRTLKTNFEKADGLDINMSFNYDFPMIVINFCPRSFPNLGGAASEFEIFLCQLRIVQNKRVEK